MSMSAEEKGIIELRSSNYLSNFQIISMETPKHDLEDIILKKIVENSRRIFIMMILNDFMSLFFSWYLH